MVALAVVAGADGKFRVLRLESPVQDLWKLGRASEGTDLAFQLQFSIRSPASLEVEAHLPADVVMSVFQFLDSRVCHPSLSPLCA